MIINFDTQESKIKTNSVNHTRIYSLCTLWNSIKKFTAPEQQREIAKEWCTSMGVIYKLDNEVRSVSADFTKSFLSHDEQMWVSALLVDLFGGW